MPLADFYFKFTELGVVLFVVIFLFSLLCVGYAVSQYLTRDQEDKTLNKRQTAVVIIAIIGVLGAFLATSSPLGDNPDPEGDYITSYEARLYLEARYGASIGKCEGRGQRDGLDALEGNIEPNEYPWVVCSVTDIDEETATREGIFPGETVTVNLGP